MIFKVILGLWVALGLVMARRFFSGSRAKATGALAGSSLFFRFFILPSCVLLWPLLMAAQVSPVSPSKEQK